jgi:hypothetical protein
VCGDIPFVGIGRLDRNHLAAVDVVDQILRKHRRLDQSVLVFRIDVDKPLYNLSFNPQRLLFVLLAIFSDEPNAVLLSILPLTPVELGAIAPHVLAVAAS